jgi:thiamine biosynthesis lipoprotein
MSSPAVLPAPAVVDRARPLMGTTVRVLAEGSDRAALAAGANRADAVLDDVARRLTRFDPASELSALNRDPGTEVRISPLLAAAVAAALGAAVRTGGLADPTLLGALEDAGYARSRAYVAPEPLARALASAPTRRPGRRAAPARWREISVDEAAGVVRRPPGVRLDLGGVAKGLAADLAAAQLEPACDRGAVDCGGDVRAVGAALPVEVEHPLTGGVAATLELRAGAVATSGLARRVWRDAAGRPAHHLLDPATGAPAWTGLVSATALAPTAVEAEARAKAALLSGPGGAPGVLRPHGGVLVADDGSVTTVEPLVVRLSRAPA